PSPAAKSRPRPRSRSIGRRSRRAQQALSRAVARRERPRGFLFGGMVLPTWRMRAVSKSGEKILRGARKVLSYAKGEARARRVHSVAVPERIDVAAIRTRLNLSQQQFADRFGFSVANIRNWEQGFRRP